MPMEFLHGRPLSPEELEMIRRQVEEFEVIGAVDDEIRGIALATGLTLLSKRRLTWCASRAPPTKTKWHVYLQARAARREWVGEIEAVDERLTAKSVCDLVRGSENAL